MTSLVWIMPDEVGVLSVSGAGLWSALTNSPAIESTIKQSGNYSIHFTSAGTTCYARKPASGVMMVGRFYFLVHAVPGTTSEIFMAVQSAGSSLRFRINPSTYLLTVSFGTGSARTYGPISLDVWYRVDFRANIAGTISYCDWQVNGVDQVQVQLTQTASVFTYYQPGCNTATTHNFYIDNAIFSTSNGDYPLGDGFTEVLKPTADGTHNSGTVIKNTGGVVIDGTPGKTAYDLLDEIPMTSTADYVQQTGIDVTKYAEVDFTPTARTSILGAMAVLAYHASGTAANNGQARIRDSAGQETIVFSGDMSESSLFFKTAMVTVPAAGWTQTTVNGLLGRVGYSSDATPVPYWDGLVLILASGAVSTINGILGQALSGIATTLVGTIETHGWCDQGFDDMTKTLDGAVAITGSSPNIFDSITNSLFGGVEVKGHVGV
jgi:hypothetical protein